MSGRKMNIHDAKTHFSRLVDEVVAGEEIIIARAGKPLVRLTQLAEKKAPIRFGLLKGKASMSADFNAPLPDELLAAFEGR